MADTWKPLNNGARAKRNFSVGGFQMDTSKSPTKTLQNLGGKFSTQNLQFPLDVAAGDAGLGNHGHYIMFYINAQERSKLRTSPEGSGRSIVEGRKQYNIPKFLKEWDSVSKSYKKVVKSAEDAKQINDSVPTKDIEDQIKFFSGDEIPKNKKKVGNVSSGSSTIRVQRAPTKRLKTAIALYMPPSVQVTYGANYTDTEIGGVTDAALEAYNAFAGGNYSGAAEAVLNANQDIADNLKKTLLGAIGILPGFGGTREAFEMKEGAVIADRLELAFKGINKRSFQYTFKMIPKNQKEAEEIRKIVFAFKSNMLPEFVGGNRSGRRLVVPNTFDIQYMYMGSSNQYLHHISTCVLENINVSYGGDRYRTFQATEDGAPPVETQITLAFKEMELITRERVFEGF